MIKIKDQGTQVVGFVASAFPLAAFLLTRIWGIWAVAALFGSGPSWWPLRGLEIGLIPSVLCGIYGLIACVVGFVSRTGLLVAGGIWCCLAAPVIGVLYVAATF